ncbi:MAG: carbohydrate-binding protein [Lachnospiraceae bacterium]|jgi:predicted alpha-1,2-mannosidase|nr:carbohydrate-binding protein [Lachnospiraceae bacterium]
MRNKRWKYSRVMATMLATAMTITTALQPMGVQAAVPNDNYENKTKHVLWSTSFEEGESALENFKESTADAGRETQNVESGLSSSSLVGDITRKVDLASITGTENYNTTETKEKLFDSNSGTKFYTRIDKNNAHAPTADDPVWVNFSLEGEEAEVVTVYAITSANDSPNRDPKSWTLKGSKDGETWVVLDEQSGQAFSKRFEQKIYEIENTESYAHYRIEVTENNGSNMDTQFADLNIGTGIPTPGDQFMAAKVAKGPSNTWNQASNRGWTGAKSLEVSGTQMGEGAFASNVLFDNLNTEITEDTYLSYVIFPSLTSSAYDYEYTSMHMAIDLKFKDGTYLSELEEKALDQNENVLEAGAQGASRVLNTNQWNRIYSNIGKVAAGKTVEQVLVVFDKDAKEAQGNLNFLTYFDDIELYTKQDTKREHLSDYVYILRGTNDTPGFSRGLTAPGVTVPHGFNFWVPCTNSGDNKTYDYQDTQLQYVTVSHEPSYWVGDRGTWQFMVNTSLDGESGSYNSGSRAASFSHDNEVAKAHYYSVEFDDTVGNNAKGAKMEMTSTDHCGVVKATFAEGTENKNFVFDCVRAGGGFAFEEGNRSFTAYSDHTGNGSKRMYVYGEFSEAATKAKANGKQAVAQFAGNTVEMKVATSYISYDQAKKNLELEVGASTFDQVMKESQATWDETLGVVSDVKGATEEEMISLYSNLYRLFMYPNNMSENVGTNENPDWKYKSPYKDANAEPVSGHKIYINNGFWDTYRTTWSAYALLTPNKAPELLNGLVQHYNDQTWVPRWIAPGGTNSMVGTSSDVIFADAMMRGIEFDSKNAYDSALRNAATVSSNLTGGGRKNLNTSIFAGYTAGTDENFSWTIEGYINDFGISQMAKALAEKETDPAKKADYLSEYQYYRNRAQNYALLFDNAGDDISQKWLRGKESNGNWTTENTTNGVYDPVRWRGDYTETNGYNMSVSVPQDGQGLANLYGGREQLAAKIDSILEDESPYSGYGAENGQGGIHEQLEAREVKMGQYGHNNQPAHHILYMYNYAGEPWKAQKNIRDVLDRCYTGSTFGQGYLGDEDNGEMSGWYIFSALGFYPVTVGSDEFAIGSPLFDSATVNMDNGKKIKITANNNSKENVYIQSMTLNGQPYTKNYLKHEDLANGAEIVFEMGNTPNKEWGSKEEDLPTSLTEGTEQPAPKKDATNGAATVDGAEDVKLGPVEVNTLYGDITGVKDLIDNNSNTTATLKEGKTTLVYASSAPKNVELITLSSDGTEGTAPTGMKIYGANEGGTWTELATYDNISFQWTRYTRPFAVNSEENYSFYKVELTGGTSLAEIEFLASEDLGAELKALIVRAKKVLGEQEDMIGAVRDLMIDRLAAAQVVSDDPEASRADLQKAFSDLQEVVSRADSIRSAHERIEAEEFSDKHSEIVNDGANIGGVKKGTWAMYQDVKFGGPISSFEICYAGQERDAGGYVEVYVDEKDNPDKKILTIETPTTGSDWSNYVTVDTKDVNSDLVTPGCHDVYLVFKNNTNKAYVANVDWFRFNRINHEEVMEKIEAIGEVTLASRQAVAEARKLYEGLTNLEKAQVTNRKKLEEAERILAELEDELTAVDDVISKIGEIGIVTLESEAVILEARAAFDALTEEQQAAVTNAAVLVSAETTLQQLKTDKTAAEAVVGLIGRIGSPANEAAVTAAREAYDKLTGAQKDLVGVENLTKLTEAEVQIAQKKGDEAAAAKVVELISKLADVDLNSETAIAAARTAYNNLSDAQKAMVGNLQTLENAERKIVELKDAAAAAEVTGLIGNIGQVALNSETAIASARAAYNSLSDTQKNLVTNLQVLVDAEAALAQAKSDKEAADAVANMINQMDDNSEQAVTAARAAYDKLTDAQKAMVGVASLTKLTNAEAKLSQGTSGQDRAKQVSDMIGQLTNVTLDSAKDVEKARIAYDLLNAEQKKLVTNVKVLEDAEKRISDLRKEAADKAAAEKVSGLIGSIGDVALNSETAIASARAEYNKLTADQKKLVTNVKVLEDAEAALAQAKEDKKAADTVIGLIGKLTGDSKADVEAARAAYNNLSDAQKAMVGVGTLAKLTEAENQVAQNDREQASVSQVVEMIGKLTNVSLDSAKDVEKARVAYDMLSDAQKAQVTNLAVLEAAEKKVKELEDASKEPVRLATPKILSVKSSITSKAGGRVKISFQKPAAGQKIYVYRKIGGIRKFIGKTTGSYIYDNSPASGKTASYLIKAVPNDKTKFRNSLSSKLVNLTVPANPSSVKVKALGKKQVKVSWANVKGADKYYIYRSAKKDSGYTRIASVKASKKAYVDKKATVGKTYYYKVVVKKASKYSAGKTSKAVKVKK